MVEIYIPEEVQLVRNFYGERLTAYRTKTIGERLNALSQTLYQGLLDKNPVTLIEVSNYHPNFLGLAKDVHYHQDQALSIAQETIRAEFGFSSWKQVKDLSQMPHPVEFERAIDDLLEGRLDRMRATIKQQPGLIHQCSLYGHRATLLHYCGNNGVEIYRQMIPDNLDKIVTFLLDQGADPNHTMRVYGGEYTALALYQTSGHPWQTQQRAAVIAAFDKTNY